MASGRRYLCNRMHRTQWCLRMAHADAPTRLGSRYLCNRTHLTQWCLRIMTHADNTCRYVPRVWNHAISVTART